MSLEPEGRGKEIGTGKVGGGQGGVGFPTDGPAGDGLVGGEELQG